MGCAAGSAAAHCDLSPQGLSSTLHVFLIRVCHAWQGSDLSQHCVYACQTLMETRVQYSSNINACGFAGVCMLQRQTASSPGRLSALLAARRAVSLS